MLRLGSNIRLTRAEQARLQHLTGIALEDVYTPDDLRHYVARCKAHYAGSSEDTLFLHWLIDEELTRCLTA